MIQWQTALGLSSEKMYLITNLPLTKLTTALQTQNLRLILGAAEAITRCFRVALAGGGEGDRTTGNALESTP